MFNIGDRILNINPDRSAGVNKGKKGEVTDIIGDKVYVRYDDGTTGKSDNPERYYKVISEVSRETTPPTNMFKSITKFIKNATLSSGEKLMRKHGLKTDCGDYTETAKELVINKLCTDNEEFLIETATSYDAELKADKE